jgi:prepilin-type N-terminal cleavage/methylation domain-containing protein
MNARERVYRIRTAGFTLVELSVVLIIVGLIVGGILSGRDLIRAAEIRATIGQVEKYNAAVNTFRLKYGGIPGDLQVATASSYGLFTFVGTNAARRGLGDGNGRIESSFNTSAEELTKANGEVLAFWRHMSDAQLAEGVYGTIGNAAINPDDGSVSGAIPNAEVEQVLPKAKIGWSNFFPVYASGGFNYFEIHSLDKIDTNGWYDSRANLLLVPLDASRIDSKMDNGFPNTGAVVARGGAGSLAGFNHGGLNQPPNNSSGGLCVTGAFSDPPDPAAEYNVTLEAGACALRLRFN